MTREEFMDMVYSELHSDCDNCRANRIIDAADEYAETEQQPKTGRWYIDERPESDREIICSNCEQPIFKYHKMDFDYRPKYCPNCGAKMESEDKE